MVTILRISLLTFLMLFGMYLLDVPVSVDALQSIKHGMGLILIVMVGGIAATRDTKS